MDDKLNKKKKNKNDDDLNQISGLEERVKNLEDQLKRAVADYQNLEKRVAEGRSELTNWGTGELIKKILPVLDHLDKALGGATEEEQKSGWYRGVKLSVGELKTVLKSEGLDEVECEGQFDPNLHEAVDMREPSDAEAMEGKGDNMILEVAEKGYNLKGKILKPAKVIVGRKLESSNKNQELSEENS